MPRPLDGYRVLDVTIFQNGPWSTAMMADMGADVIHIEDPVTGDPGRSTTLHAQVPTVSPYFETMNRGKRSITLNLKSEEGQGIFYRMAEKADVVVQNFRVGVMKRLKIDYETIRQINPKIIYCSISGFGSRGPDAQDGVFDLLGQARSGYLAIMRLSDDELRYQVEGGLSDQMGATYASQAIMWAIIARERYGIGQHVEVSQLAGQLVLQAMGINSYLHNRQIRPPADRTKAGNPLFNIYRCSDRKWIALGCVQADRFWSPICKVLKMGDLENAPRFATRDSRTTNCTELIGILDERFATRPRDSWIPDLKAEGCLCTPVQDYSELEADPQIIANEYIVDVPHPVHGNLREVGVPARLSETPGKVLAAAPEFGQHTEDLLLEHGYSWEDIAHLHEIEAI